MMAIGWIGDIPRGHDHKASTQESQTAASTRRAGTEARMPAWSRGVGISCVAVLSD